MLSSKRHKISGFFFIFYSTAKHRVPMPHIFIAAISPSRIVSHGFLAVLSFRPHNSYSSISKMEVSEDNEPALSKLDVVLSFTLEVSSIQFF